MRLARGESLTLEEQRDLVSSHEQLRARVLVVTRRNAELADDLKDEKARVDRLVRDPSLRPSARRTE